MREEVLGERLREVLWVTIGRSVEELEPGRSMCISVPSRDC